MKSWHRRVLALLLAALMTSCGGGGGDGGGGGTPPPAGLSGTWLGTHEDADLFLSTVSVTISGGSVTDYVRDGFDTGLIGPVTQQSPTIMRYSLSNGAEMPTGVFLVDADLMHATFADDELNFGVLQKNAGSLPSFNETDLVGAWTGVAVVTDFSGFFDQASASLSCTFTTALNCTLTDPSGTFNATFSAPDFRGRWMGAYTGPTTGNANAFMSADKSFLAAWACDDPDQFWPEDCVFYALRR